MRRDDEAIASFNKALEINPDYASAYYNKAACYGLQRQVELSLLTLQQAIELNPRYKEDAVTDLDFDDIADDERFKELVEQ